MKDLQVKYTDPLDLIPYENNPRINDYAVKKVMESIKEYGFTNPIIVDADMDNWVDSCMRAEKTYNYLISEGRTPQEARSVLPNSLKTEVVMTANLREWRHFLSLRACGSTGKPHPQMLEVAVPLLKELRERVPVVFDDLEPMEWETVK